MTPLLIKQPRTNQQTTDRKEELHTAVAIVLQTLQAHAANLNRPRVIRDHRKDRNRPPSIERRNISGALSLRLFPRRSRFGLDRYCRHQFVPRYDRTMRSRNRKALSTSPGTYSTSATTPRSLALL